MCGVAAIIGQTDRHALDAMAATLWHRGPDARGTWIDPHGLGGVASTRLAIVDQPHGQQPFVTDGTTWVVNGELYNADTLRHELPAGTCRTGSDSEVVGHTYLRHGASGMLHRLDGMHAGVLLDTRRGSFAAWRDRLGIKPLWYVHRGDQWWIGSEVKALRAAGVDLSRVRRLPPGHLLTRTGERAYHRLERRHPASVDDPRLLLEILRAATRRHLMADPDLTPGVLLSGGLDSSLVAALVAEVRPDVVAFTIGAEGSPDVQAARLVAAHLGIKHEVVALDLDELEASLPGAVLALETYNPMFVVEGAIQMALARAVRDHGVKYVLIGEGADEIAAGYGVFRTMPRGQVRPAMLSATTAIGDTEAMRVDRALMAYGVEGRPVFLDPLVVNHVINMPLSALLHHDGHRVWEKWALRCVAELLLPHEVAWRPKTSFDEGAGSLEILSRLRARIPGHVVEAAQLTYPHARIATPEAAYLHDIFLHGTDEDEGFGEEVGGDRVFNLFGNYPLLQRAIDSRDPHTGGTGEDSAGLQRLHEDNAALLAISS